MSRPLPLVLASASPRRRALLAAAGIPAEVVPADIDETARAGEGPADLVERLAREKSETIARDRPDAIVLGADTIVVLDGEILGKPRDAAHAIELLSRLAGETHTVVTGVAVATGGGRSVETTRVETRVRLRPADAAEIAAYVATGEPLDKAGAYALQGEGGRFVSAVDGSRTNVIGLPMDEALALLAACGGASPGREFGVAARLAETEERIRAAAVRAGRSRDAITLVGVSKRHPPGAIVAGSFAGLRHFGENFAQELRDKAEATRALLADTGLPEPRWHFIGRLQRNKARVVAPLCHCVETVDSAALARELDRRVAGSEPGNRRLGVLVQVDVSEEPQKGGVAPGDLAALLETVGALGHLDLRGLMAIPAARATAEAMRPAFARLRELRDTHGGPAALPELSMGMSSDYEVAIEEGATIIRVGTAIFGPRES